MKQKDIDNILKSNKKLDWVKRLYEKDTPSIVLPGQEYPSTHYMESSDNLVYPTIIRNADGKLEYLGNKARDYAIKTNTAIKFDTEEDAAWFGENYKQGTDVLKEFKKGGKITAETIYSVSKQPKVILTPNDIYAKDGANIDLSNTTGDRKVFSLDEFKNIVPNYQYQGYLNSGKEGMYKNVDKSKYPVLVDTLPDGSVTYRPYSYESAETSYEDYKKLSQSDQPIKATPIKTFAGGGMMSGMMGGMGGGNPASMILQGVSQAVGGIFSTLGAQKKATEQQGQQNLQNAYQMQQINDLKAMELNQHQQFFPEGGEVDPIENGKQFLKDWYSQRSELSQFKNISNKFLEKLPLVKNINVSQGNLNVNKALAYEQYGNIYTNKDNSESNEASIHEITHALHNRASNYLYGADIIKKNIVSKSDFKGATKDNGYNYYSAPTEVYARLNTFRNLMELDPKKNYTIEDVKTLMDKYNNPKSYNEKNFKSDKERDIIINEYNKIKKDYIETNPKTDIKNTEIDEYIDKGASGFVKSLDKNFYDKVSKIVDKYQIVKDRYNYSPKKNADITDLFNIVGNDPSKLSNLLNDLAQGNSYDNNKSFGEFGINIMNKGGKVEPIYTDNPKDKRLQAYNDSLKIYNSSEKIKNEFLKKQTSDEAWKYSMSRLPYDNDNKIQPIKWLNLVNQEVSGGYPQYKKPVQPVIYKKEVNVPVPKVNYLKNILQTDEEDIKIDFNSNLPIPQAPNEDEQSTKGKPLPDYLIQQVKTPNGMKTYKRKDTNSPWLEQDFEKGGIVQAWIQKFVTGGMPNPYITPFTDFPQNEEFKPYSQYNVNPQLNNNAQIANTSVPNVQTNFPQNIGTNYQTSANASQDQINKDNKMADEMMGKMPMTKDGKMVGTDETMSKIENMSNMGQAIDLIGSSIGDFSNIKGDVRNSTWQDAKAAAAKSNPIFGAFHGIDEGLQGIGKMIGGDKGQKGVQFFTDPIGFWMNLGSGIKTREEDKRKKQLKYDERNMMPIVNQPSHYGNYHAKYGSNIKNMEQRVIDDIYSDFDKYMKKV